MSAEEWYRLWMTWGNPVVQIGVLTVVIYWLLLALERINAGVKLRGLAVILIFLVLGALLARFMEMHAITWMLQNAVAISAVILAIIFQPEVRRLFMRMGGLLRSYQVDDNSIVISHLVNACDYMSKRRIGALMVIQRQDKLDDYIGAAPLDAEVTSKLLTTIFWKDTPLHDGALIIRGGRIAAAGVILPLTENFEYKDLSGTRHRAGIGVTEETDAFAVLVSEETGTISVADRGKLIRDLDRDDLEILLTRIFGRSDSGKATR